MHEYLDAVLGPQTVIELAREAKYHEIPSTDPEQLAAWFYQGANKGSLPEYRRGFAHTIAVVRSQHPVTSKAAAAKAGAVAFLGNDGAVSFAF